MSWAYTGSSTNTDIAFNNAHAADVVLVGTSANSDHTPPDPVQYPGSHPKVMAVGASDHDDRRHHLNSPDGPGWPGKWESNYGPELSVVAPVPCWTTAKNGGYSQFTGTSAAAPQVAGLAALLLSLLQHPVNIPGLTQKNDLVRYIIESTARKVGGYSYTNDTAHPNGTWNAEMGYGLINVDSALRFARDNYTTYKLERPSRDYAVAVQILFGVKQGGGGLVFPPGGPPVPVDPSWQHLTQEKRDVLLALAITELAGGINDREARRALERAGREAIEGAARQIGQY